VCPRCGFYYLHQSVVTVYSRAREDDPTVEIEVRNTATIEVRTKATRNPSSRRDGLAILFDCENCDFVGELTIAQHKGNTLVGWRESKSSGMGRQNKSKE
jgi:hypothetical protein